MIVGSKKRASPEPDRLLYTAIYSTAQRLGGWTAPVGEKRAAAVAELRERMRERTDLAVEAAGVMLGYHHPETAQHAAYAVPAGLLLEAVGVEENAPEVQRWVGVGRERWDRRYGGPVPRI